MSTASYPRVWARVFPTVVAAFGLLAGLASLRAEENPPADRIVELPKFVVTDSRMLPPPESWRYASLPGVEVLSNSSERVTRRLVSDFQKFRDALEIVWPVPARMNTPMLLILCNKNGQFDSFQPANSDGGPLMGRASIYLKGRNQSAIVIDMGSSAIDVISLDADVSTGGSNQMLIDHNKQLYREYVHYLLSKSDPRLPPWFEEGMAQIIMGMTFNPKWIEFGRLEESGTVSAGRAAAAQMNALSGASGDEAIAVPDEPAEDRDFNVALVRRALLPMQKMFDVAPDAPEVRNPLGNNTWAKQVYAFVHLGLYGYDGKFRKQFSDFLIKSTQQPVTEELFKQCFKMSYKDMQYELRSYITAPMYRALIAKPTDGKPLFVEENFEIRDATPAEVGRIKGRAKLIAGRTEEARTELIAPYVRGDRDPQLLASLGLIEHLSGKDDRSRQFLEAAVAAKTSDPEAYLELARFRLTDALVKPAGKDGRLSAAQVTPILTLLRTARTLPPHLPAVYDLMADTLTRADDRASRDDLLMLVQGVMTYPNKLKLTYETAALCADAGIFDAAHDLTAHGLRLAPDEATRTKFQQLKASLPPDAAPAAPAAPAATKTATKTGGK